MSIREWPVLFNCEDEELLGVISAPSGGQSETGVLVIVGGPQYRAGSHRMFVILARELATRGISCMRFDYRGMGDGTGLQRGFEEIGSDIRSALDVLVREVPGLQRIMLWGLCDGASAASMYCASDQRIAGLVLVNPWVRTETSEARTMLRHYYLRRIFELSFWRKLLSGRIRLRESLRRLRHWVRRSQATGQSSVEQSAAGQDLCDRMGQSLARAGKPFGVILSERDPVAHEFRQLVVEEGRWQQTCGSFLVAQHEVKGANHTCARAEWREEMMTITERLIRGLSVSASFLLSPFMFLLGI